MSRWQMVRLGDVCETRHDRTFPLSEEKVWLLNLDKIEPQTGKILAYEYVKSSELGQSICQFDDSNVLYSKLRPYLNKVVLPEKSGFATSELIPLSIKNNIEREYLAAFLRSDFFVAHISEKVAGAKMPRVIMQDFYETAIPLPPLEVQRQMAATLDKCTVIIVKHKAMLEKYDLLIKSRFVEMFGDPVANPMGWEMRKMKEITSKIGSGATPRGGRESYVCEGIPLIRSMNVYNGHFEYDGLAYITELQARELENVTLKENDVLLNITGASVARCCILPKGILPARVNQHVSILRAKEIVNPLFLCNLLISDSEQKILLRIGDSGGATREAITKNDLEEMRIPVPPLPLQKQFAGFVRKTDAAKAKVRESLQKTETLYKALMQDYFG